MQPSTTQDAATRARQAAQVLTQSLTNPYGVSSHYAQAYHSQQSQSHLSTNVGASWTAGHASTSYYPPGQATNTYFASNAASSSRLPNALPPKPIRGTNPNFRRNPATPTQQTHWYEPGSHRCEYEACAFQGSKKSLEIHKMDRHLVYPTDWNKHKRKLEWDADPSLNTGKPLPIQGTSVLLDTQEAIDAWIAERRKRWPSKVNVQEKEKKLQEAVDRGELFPSETIIAGRGKKRPRGHDDSGVGRRGRGRGRGRGSGRDGQSTGERPPNRAPVFHPLPSKPIMTVQKTKDLIREENSDDEGSSGSDMDPEKDAISSKCPVEALKHAEAELSNVKGSPGINELAVAQQDKDVEAPKQQDSIRKPLKPLIPRPPPKPRAAPHNPFSGRPSLLLNLLLPEIRMTVSNLSQAIHFLVQNDFLENVELNPGDADEKLIEVLDDEAPCRQDSPTAEDGHS